MEICGRFEYQPFTYSVTCTAQLKDIYKHPGLDQQNIFCDTPVNNRNIGLSESNIHMDLPASNVTVDNITNIPQRNDIPRRNMHLDLPTSNMTMHNIQYIPQKFDIPPCDQPPCNRRTARRLSYADDTQSDDVFFPSDSMINHPAQVGRQTQIGSQLPLTSHGSYFDACRRKGTSVPKTRRTSVGAMYSKNSWMNPRDYSSTLSLHTPAINDHMYITPITPNNTTSLADYSLSPYAHSQRQSHRFSLSDYSSFSSNGSSVGLLKVASPCKREVTHEAVMVGNNQRERTNEMKEDVDQLLWEMELYCFRNPESRNYEQS